MLPHLLAGIALRDAWISAALGSLIELGLLFIVLRAITLQKDNDIYGSLRRNVGQVGAKTVLFVLLLFFVLQALISLKTTSYLLNETLYEDLDFHAFAIPLLIAGVFFCYMQTRAVFRAGEIFSVLVLIGLGLSFLPSLIKINPSEVLPMLDGGLPIVFSGFYRNLIYFESGAVLLVFMGDVETDKGFTRKFMIAATVAAVVFVFAIFLFTSIFGPLASAKQLAIVNLTQVSSYIAQNGRLEWIMVLIWLVLLLMRFGITFFCCFALLRYITGIKKFQPAAIALPLAIVFYAIHARVIVSVADLNIFIENLLPFILGFYIAVPFFFAVNACINKNKGVSKNGNT